VNISAVSLRQIRNDSSALSSDPTSSIERFTSLGDNSRFDIGMDWGFVVEGSAGGKHSRFAVLREFRFSHENWD
jgi:hypothetical protein